MQLMNSVWNICGRDVVTAFDLSPFRNIYDLGGKITRRMSCTLRQRHRCQLSMSIGWRVQRHDHLGTQVPTVAENTHTHTVTFICLTL